MGVKKMKMYLDTTIISHLDQQDNPDWMEITLKFWKWLKESVSNNEAEFIISPIVTQELDKCSTEKREKLYSYLAEIPHTIVALDIQTDELAQMIIDQNILKESSREDCQHIASSIVQNCDCIVSWNFKHIVNHKTIKGLKIISAISGYNTVEIYTPEYFIGGDGDYDED